MKKQAVKRFMQKKLHRLLKAKLHRKQKKLSSITHKASLKPEPPVSPSLPVSCSWSEIVSRLKTASQGAKR